MSDTDGNDRPLAFSWRMSRSRADQLDALTRAVRDELGWARLARAEMLDALADYTQDHPELVAELARRVAAKN
jgi:HD-GYP domain-containing protein (c-di-GMP phosphodiesterase class II)